MHFKFLSVNRKNGFNKIDFLILLFCAPFWGMLILLACEAGLAALTTALIIQAGHDLANGSFIVSDFLWIVLAQSASYLIGASSWIFAEQAGFGAYGRYILLFNRTNRGKTDVLRALSVRESAEPFITNEVFHIIFEFIYELEADLKLFLGLLFNIGVLGYTLDGGLPWVYASVFALLLGMQWVLRRPIANAYLKQQSDTNRMTAHTYQAWNNIFAGNRYNFRIWHAGFKDRLRIALRSTIRAILAREGLAAVGGVVALGIVFTYLAVIVASVTENTSLLITLATTLPRQIEMSSNVHRLASGWNDLLAIWTRIGGACKAMDPHADSSIEHRIQFDRLHIFHVGNRIFCQQLEDLIFYIQTIKSGRIELRGFNGAGKSSLLTALKRALGSKAYFLPHSDKLTFAYINQEEEKFDYSSGETQLYALKEITEHSNCQVYLLDEWDANLDMENRAKAELYIEALADRAVVVEISHRDSEYGN